MLSPDRRGDDDLLTTKQLITRPNLQDEVSLLRLPELKSVTGLSKSSLYALIRAKSFPPPGQLGPRTAAWVRSEVRQCAAKHIQVTIRIPTHRGETDTTTRSWGILGNSEEVCLGRSFLPALSKLCIQIVGPPLHHLCTLLQIFRMVVGCSDLVAFRVGELKLDVGLIELMLVENGRCQSTESVPSH